MTVRVGRKSAVIAGIAACSLVLAACGDDADDEGSATGEAEDSEAAVPTAMCDGEIEGGTVTMYAHEGSEADAIQQAVDDFNAGEGADLGITVELTFIPEGQYTDTVTAAAAAGDLPTIVDLDGPVMANFAWTGALVALDDCIPDEVRDNQLPSLIEQGTYADALWAVGTFDSGLGLYAWRSALEEVGARIPESADDAWTVEEFETILKDLQAAGYDEPLDTKFWYGSQGEWFSYGFAPILWSAGGDLIDRTDYQSADGVLNSPESVEALTTFQGWIDDGLISKDAVDDSVFLEKTSPISWVGHWMYPAYKEAAGDDLVVLPLPDFGTGSKTGMGSWAWGLTPTANDGDPDTAWAVMEYFLSDPVVTAISDAGGTVPGTKSAIEGSELFAEGGDLALYVEQLEAAPDVAVPRPVTPAYPTMTLEFRRIIDDIRQGADVQQTLDAAVEVIDSDIEANEGYPEPGS